MHNRKTYIIAEIGINHNGKLSNCFKLIDSAVSAGCDAAKFQFFKAATLYPKSAGKLKWKDKKKSYSYDIYKAVDGFSMPKEWVDDLISYSKKNKIEFLSSVFNIAEAKYLIKCGMKQIKLSSYTITHLPLIEYCASTKLPMVISTGGAGLHEIKEAVSVAKRYHNDISLLHCSLSYPTKLSDCNLAVLETFHSNFPDIKIGYSDHTKEVSFAAKQAVYLGAQVIEKHITLDKQMAGPDHFFSLNPAELKTMVKDIRKAEIDKKKGNFKIEADCYGSSSKLIYPHEEYLRKFAFMRLYARKQIKKGERIRQADLIILRPGNKEHGLEPKHLNLFKEYSLRANKNINVEDPITWSLLF